MVAEPHTIIDEQKASYDAFAAHYREYSETKHCYISAVDALIQDAASNPKTILDYGAGDGIRGARLKDVLGAQHLVQGDISREMLNLCERNGAADVLVDTSMSNWEVDIGRFDFICALWNVIGLIPDPQCRVVTLKKLKALLAKKGVFAFDVNNRHNRCYGEIRSRYRRLIDWCFPNIERGDAHFQWNIDGQSFTGYGHLFTLNEVMGLLDEAGFSRVSWYAVNYTSGEVSHEAQNGQLLFVCRND